MTRGEFERICKSYNLEYHQEVFWDMGIVHYFLLNGVAVFKYHGDEFSYKDCVSGQETSRKFASITNEEFDELVRTCFNK